MTKPEEEFDIYTPVLASTILDEDHENNTHTYKIYKGLRLFRWSIAPRKDVSPKITWFLNGWWKERCDYSYKAFGFRLLGLDIEILKSYDKGSYNCICGWTPPEESYKTEYTGDSVYPKIEGYTSSAYASYEFGINGHSWNEAHYCPLCQEEFEYSNSDY